MLRYFPHQIIRPEERLRSEDGVAHWRQIVYPADLVAVNGIAGANHVIRLDSPDLNLQAVVNYGGILPVRLKQD